MSILLIALATLSFDVSDKSDADKAESKKAAALAKQHAKAIIGKWKVKNFSLRGQVRKDVRNTVLEFKNGRLVTSTQSGSMTVEYKLDPSNEPHHMDQILNRGGKKYVRKCIYSLEKNTLKIAQAPRVSSPRPKSLSGKGENLFIVLERIGKKK